MITKVRKQETRSYQWYNYQHLKKRCWERFGIEITERDVSSWLLAIYDGKTIPVHVLNMKGAAKCHEIEFMGKKIWLIYSPNTKTIKTVLPPFS